jgi:hypothetical protein
MTMNDGGRTAQLVAIAAATLLPLPACGFSIVGDARADCERIEDILSRLGVRCGGHGLDADVLGCDELVISATTSADVDECEQWADRVDCGSVRAPNFHPPDACRFRAIRLP